MSRISQAEARRLKRRVNQIEEAERLRRVRWRADYPGGTHLGSVDLSGNPRLAGRIEGARMLKHAIVATIEGDGVTLNVYALPLAEAKP